MYEKFASVYDELMADIPYENYLTWILHEAGPLQEKTIVDLGCGTGTLSIPLAHMGADVHGIDLSQMMIEQAKAKAQEEQAAVHFSQGSMADFTAARPADVVVIAVDSLNYLVDEEEVVKTLRAAFHALQPGGHLFFDVHSTKKIEAYLDGPFIYEDEDVAYLWSTEPGEEDHSVYHDITFFVRAEDGRYERFEEHHYQRTFEIEMYKQWIHELGFSNCLVDDSIFGGDHKGLRYFFHATK